LIISLHQVNRINHNNRYLSFLDYDKKIKGHHFGDLLLEDSVE